ncbi:hypothetical protein Nmel_003009, partial [Mimus melanotis]
RPAAEAAGGLEGAEGKPATLAEGPAAAAAAGHEDRCGVHRALAVQSSQQCVIMVMGLTVFPTALRSQACMLSACVKGQHEKGSPFTLMVKHKFRERQGVFHCCMFCSSGGQKAAHCACGGTMPVGCSVLPTLLGSGGFVALHPPWWMEV